MAVIIAFIWSNFNNATRQTQINIDDTLSDFKTALVISPGHGPIPRGEYAARYQVSSTWSRNVRFEAQPTIFVTNLRSLHREMVRPFTEYLMRLRLDLWIRAHRVTVRRSWMDSDHQIPLDRLTPDARTLQLWYGRSSHHVNLSPSSSQDTSTATLLRRPIPRIAQALSFAHMRIRYGVDCDISFNS